MEEQRAARRIDAQELSAKIAANGREILRYEIIFPRINAKTASENRINRYHRAQAGEFERVIKSKYIPAARLQLKQLGPEGAFVPLEISASFQVMLSESALLSIFTDTYYQLRHDGQRLARSSKTYDMQTGRPLRLSALFSRGTPLREMLAAALEPQIASESERNPGAYFSDWREIYAGKIAEDAYYLTDSGVVIYFQQDAIAGANAGLPSFLVPYSALGDTMRYRA